MNSLPHSSSTTPSMRKGFNKPLWLTTFGWFVASVACVTVAVASVPSGDWSRSAATSDPVVHVEAAADSASTTLAVETVSPRMNGRCQTCGVVQVVRKLQTVGTSPAVYEMTVRLRDGSTRVSSHPSAAGWRVGDSIMVIGGAKPLAAPALKSAPIA